MTLMRRGKKGFTLVELLIVVAILGILAAVVIPSVLGLMGRGAAQAYETDQEVIQLAANAYYSDIHRVYNDGADNYWGWDDPAPVAPATLTAGHYYPTYRGEADLHTLYADSTLADPDDMNNFVLMGGAGANNEAIDADIDECAIWMGLLVNPAPALGTLAVAAPAPPAGPTREDAAPILRLAAGGQPGFEEVSLYLQEMPESASEAYNGAPVGQGGQYVWVVGDNGAVYGAYKKNCPAGVGGVLPAGDYWFSGFAGSYP